MAALGRVGASVALAWCLAFIALNLLLPRSGGQNSASRFALLRAMARHGTFRIDRYRNWTIDLAITPDRHYYSNKAPGPALLALPVALALERPAGEHRASAPGPRVEGLVALLLQGLPFVAFVIAADLLLAAEGVPVLARHFFALAAYFGNTASLLMNTFFGHGVSAWLLGALALFLTNGRATLAGLAFGFALLSDYATAPLLVPALLGLWLATRGPSFPGALARFVLGGMVPGVLWVVYHTTCFGSPWTLALAYQNPNLLGDDPGPPAGLLFGTLRLLPNDEAVRGLLFGSQRGLCVTQPWVLVAFALGLAHLRGLWRSRAAPLAVLVLLGLPIVFWLNAGYRAWHGGWCPGPRYLSALMPCAALLAAFTYARAGRLGRIALWGGLFVALVFYVLVSASDTILARPSIPLWPAYWSELRDDIRGVHGVRALIVVGALAAAGVAARLSRRAPGPQVPLG